MTIADEKSLRKIKSWTEDWNRFVRDALKARLDKEQQDIISSVQYNPMTAVASGTARGKDFVAACASLCFMYLTPRWKDGKLTKNTKIAMTAPTARQVQNIMIPEISRLYRNAGFLPGRLLSSGIKTDYEEWFLTGFKAGDDNTEAWSGFHAVNTMFVVTEASGISESTYNAIEGNLQGNSRFLIVFNPNVTTGYAARAMKSERFAKFRLDSLNAENVVSKKAVIPGQVNYEWVKDKVENWCSLLQKADFNEGEGDFTWEGKLYRPNDLFRVKVRGMFPKVSEDVLIPYEWIEIANRNWQELQASGFIPSKSCKLGVDVAGMGRDNSVLCPRYGNYVAQFEVHQSAGRADHMHVVGMAIPYLKKRGAKAFIDTIGEGAGVYSRLLEEEFTNAFSCKYSEGADGLHDITGEYEFANMRAYLYWALRDWLNPKNGFGAALPPCDQLMEEATETKWKFLSNGKIIIEAKEDIKKTYQAFS
ncbi:hypothetical protein ACIXFQ_14265 [Bacteroides fragilis]